MGFGRGYLLRKWSVITPRRVPGIIAREVSVSVGQALVDRNLGGVRGRLQGLRTGRRSEAYPAAELVPDPPSLATSLGRRWRRRARLRRRSE
jgi:hypothetical protein